ncbi:MAG: thiamine phosphate synthase [Candidatus Omnitrophica bacterium]|nr:thiamine phosphate synthase [Candidatus Omnitrophota bacterium]MDD5027322.1 thiamine phosphate synthase [Candidatus Omnitrophota bacterium]MDD5661936.1 thiamine phosphate synthase [Candidatus Omnitrophota bacterium]
MRLRRRRLQKSRLYALIDKDTIKKPGPVLAKKLAVSGVDIIQLRDKHSSRASILKEAVLISRALKNKSIIFIVNDYPDIAKLSGSDGLHIGQSDISLKKARSILGKDRLIGVSCSNLEEALEAEKAGADYLGLGPVFKTPTKAGGKPIGIKSLKEFTRRIRIPVFAIGNITRDNLKKITSCGIQRVAVCRAILKSRNMQRAAAYFSVKLKETK